MKKLLAVVALSSCFMFTGCAADDVNSTLNTVDKMMGGDGDTYNIEQEDLDAVEDGYNKVKDFVTDEENQEAAKKALDQVKDYIEDEENQQKVKDTLNTIKDAVESSQSTESGE